MTGNVFGMLLLYVLVMSAAQVLSTSLMKELQKYKFGQNGNCTFDYSLCNWQNAYSGDAFDWQRNKGRTPSAGTGPQKDAKGNSQGQYMYIESSHPRRKGEEASLYVGPLIGVLCMKFSYHMRGQDVGDLQIYMKERDHSKQLFVWARYGPQGNGWKSSNVTVYGLAYDIIVVARVGGGYRGDIAFDEVSFVPGTCFSHEDENELLMRRVGGNNNSSTVVKGSCDFDTNLCGWSQDILGDQFDWSIGGDGTPTRSTGPTKDHGGKDGGKFLFAESSSPRKFQDKTRLLSPQLCGQVCLRFFYHMYGVSMGTLSVLRNDGVVKKFDRLWYQKGNKGRKWHRAIVEVNSDQDCYQLMIEASIGRSYYSDMAIDDIYVQKGSCCDMKSELNNVDKSGNCDFKNDFCGWKNLDVDDFDWSLGKGQTKSRFTGPSNGFGKDPKDGYAFIEASEPRVVGDTAIMTSGVLLGSMCMRFRYHMYGADIGSLSVFRNGDGVMQQLLWQQDGDQGDVWHEAEFLIDCNVTAYQVEIEANVGGWRGDIAVDDISFNPGVCPPKPVIIVDYNTTRSIVTQAIKVDKFDGYCTFGFSFCSWNNDLDEDFFDWRRHWGTTPSIGTGPAQDYSGEGYYIYIEASVGKEGQFARLVSGSLKDTHCLTFQYHMHGDGVGELRVETKDSENGYLWNTTWSVSGDQGRFWNPALITVTGYDYVIGISAVRGSTHEGDIAIDSTNLLEGPCNQNSTQSFLVDAANKFDLDDCDFDKKTKCQWKDDLASNFKWSLGKGDTPSVGTGPSVDVSGNGFYAFIESSSPRVQNDVARMYIDVPMTKVCMSFYYHMRGNAVGELRVLLRIKDEKPKMIWSKKGKQSEYWQEDQLIIGSKEGAAQVIIEGVVGFGYQGDIAIDEIKFRQGACGPAVGGRS